MNAFGIDTRSIRRAGLLLAVGLTLGGPSHAQNTVTPQERQEVVALLVKTLDDPDIKVVQAAFGALEQLKPVEAVPLLIPRLRNRDPQKAGSAANLLAQVRSREGALALITAAQEARGTTRLTLMIHALQAAVHARSEGIAFCRNLASDPDPQYRAAAMHTLWQLVQTPPLPPVDKPTAR